MYYCCAIGAQGALSYLPSAVNEELSAWLGREPENTEYDFLLFSPF